MVYKIVMLFCLFCFGGCDIIFPVQEKTVIKIEFGDMIIGKWESVTGEYEHTMEFYENNFLTYSGIKNGKYKIYHPYNIGDYTAYVMETQFYNNTTGKAIRDTHSVWIAIDTLVIFPHVTKKPIKYLRMEE